MFTFKIGLLLGLSIIISIGAQNLFVIRQGLKQEYPYLSALVCFICDVCMILLGVTGVSSLLLQFPLLKKILLTLGIGFLAIYGSLALKRSFNIRAINSSLHAIQGVTGSTQAKKLLMMGISFSLLNPQAILDTMIIIGGNANQFNHDLQIFFVLGTIAASFIWFFSLAICAHYFSVKLMHAKLWCAIEMLSGLSMLFFAAKFATQIGVKS